MKKLQSKASKSLPPVRRWWGLWFLLTPFVLIFLLIVLLYVPPVQRWAVGKVTEMLSDELGMNVSVDRVSLAFPLDLSMGGMTATQDGDTLVSAESLDVSVRLLPLFKGKAEVDGIRLKNTRLNTKDMISSCELRGTVGEVSLVSHSTDLKSEYAVVNKARISDADLLIALSDSVPEDTTESSPVNWKARIDDFRLKNVKATVQLTPQNDSTFVTAAIGEANASAFLDLGKQIYKVDKFSVSNSAFAYDINTQPWLVRQIDTNHLAFDDVALAVDSLSYSGDGTLGLSIESLQARERSGLTVEEVRGKVAMDSLALQLPKLAIRTSDSKMAISLSMDLNAFADTKPGSVKLVADGQIGKDDMICLTGIGGESVKDIQTMMAETLPQQPTRITLKADGNMKALSVHDLRINVPTLASLEADATLWDVTDSLSLSTTASVRIGKASTVSLDAKYVMASEAYSIDADFCDIDVSKLAGIAEQTVVSGTLSANGHGFDFLSPATKCKGKLSLRDSHYGKINLSNIDADADIQGNKMTVALACDNEQLQTQLTLDGELNRNLVAGILNIDLPFIDAQAMGFSDDRLRCSTAGRADFKYDFGTELRVESFVESLRLRLGKDSITTEAFYMMADASSDSTALCLKTGDLDFDFYTPNNLRQLQPQIDKLLKVAQRQADKKEFDISVLKRYYPNLNLHVKAGKNNPVSQILATMGYSFRYLAADVKTSPAVGVKSWGHLYGFTADSLTVDTTFFAVTQDSARMNFRAGVRSGEQPQLPAFRAILEGYVGMHDADAHLTYHNKDGEQGIDVGLKAVEADSCYNITLYPSQPTLAFRKFSLNGDNFICIRRGNLPVLADVHLQSLTDSATISIVADENALGEQDAAVVARHIELEPLLSVMSIPNMPKMQGLLSMQANYSEEEQKFKVYGDAGIERFVYEGMSVGDVGTRFTYMPQDSTAHGIDATLAYNKADVLRLSGEYDGAGSGWLNADAEIMQIPLSMVSPFIPDQMASLTGVMNGNVNIKGSLDALTVNGALRPTDAHVLSNSYSIDLRLANDAIHINDSKLTFNNYNIYGYDDNPLALNGTVDFADFADIKTALTLRGTNFKLVDSKRQAKKVLFGDMYGNFFARVNGSTNEKLTVRGNVRVLKSSNMTYIMAETPLSQGARLDDIVTFVDFRNHASDTLDVDGKSFMEMDMNLSLTIENGARVRAELSADRQSYVDVQGGGSVTMTLTPQGVLNMQGRYTINEGEMKYTLPVIPLRTFTIRNGSYIEFTGNPANPTLNITATERTRAAVADESGASRSVEFDAGLKVSKTLENMGLEFIISAPSDLSVQSELETMGAEERNKLAVAMLATGMYLSSSNSKNFTAGNALNSFLQSEINNIAGKALNTLVNVDVGMEQTTRDNGTVRTDYSFRFSRRFFSDRLNVIIGGKISTDVERELNESGAYLDDVSLEWRLDDGGTQYVRLFHEKDYSNIIEGELDKNGAGVLLRKKVEKFSDLYFWRKRNRKPAAQEASSDKKDTK